MSKIAIVTGAGTGVGQVVAKKLSEDGMNVMLVGRRLPVKTAVETVKARKFFESCILKILSSKK